MRPVFAIYGIQDRFRHQFPAYVHDHNLCVMHEGRIEQYLHLERWSRRKYDNRLPDMMEDLLDEQVIALPKDAAWVNVNSFVGNSFISRNGRIRLEGKVPDRIEPRLWPGSGWYQESEWSGRELPVFQISHELAHIGSSLPFYGDFKENSLLVHFDGGASKGNFSAFLYRKGRLKLLECHWDLSYLSKFFNDNALTFALMKAEAGSHTSVPGKLMGYAAWGNYREEMAGWLKANDFFRECWQDQASFYDAAKTDFGWNGQLSDQHDPFLQDIAATFQGIFQKDWLNKLAQLQENIQADYLYLTGGCALNIIANSLIIASGLFQEVHIPPACNDAGLSLGAAAMYQWLNGQSIQRHSPYLNDTGLNLNEPTYDRETIQEVGKFIALGGVVGICNGWGEAGPRALGNRSIVGRPDDPDLVKKISMDCKGREWFRPLAPVMLTKNLRKVSGIDKIPDLARYMLMDFPVLPEFQDLLAGVIHANGKARIQAITHREETPFLFDLLTHLDETYQIQALINTSFNSQGEPIVHTADQALQAARKMNLDAVILNGRFQPISQLYELAKNKAQ